MIRFKRMLALVCALCLAVTVSFAALAQDSDQSDQPENPTIALTEAGLSLPEGLTSGLVTLTMQNDTENPFGPLIGRFKADTTLDTFMGALEEGPIGALPLIDLIGGLTIQPEDALDITYDLAAGEYVVLDFSGEMPNIATFTVAESNEEPAEAPEADLDINLIDFAFAIPAELPAGEQVWKIENLGQQWHEMGVMRLEEAMTKDEVAEALMAAMMSENPDGPPAVPFEEVLFWSPMDPGTAAWITVDLEPGVYAITCFLPDFSSEEGMSHLAHGMIAIVTVTE